MNESSKKEKREFLLSFIGSESVSLFKNAFSEIAGKKVQFAFLDGQRRLVKDKKRYNKLISGIKDKTGRARLRKIRLLKYQKDKHCLFIPIRQGDNLYGYIFVANLLKPLDKNYHSLIHSFVDIALKEFQKERELTKLYDTIRPRAIALSTVHTIHRLLSSTLDMDELIERMTRLTLQVMRAKYCAIMFLDESKNCLIPKSIIDLKNNAGKLHKRYRKIKICRNTIGKVAKTGKTGLQRNSICVPLIEENIIGVICVKNKTNNAPFSKFDMEILLTLAEQAVIAIKNAQLYAEQERMAYGSIKSLAALLDAKSPNTYTHSELFVKIVLAIADEMKLSRDQIRDLRFAALLPDTGKFSIPEEILKKPGGLSKEEYTIIKRQHLESLKILQPMGFLKSALPIIIHHHERYDGTGYPDGLKGNKIPLGARIMAVADAFEAMVSSRPYKDTNISISQAIKEIRNNTCTQFDPDVVDAFISITKKPGFNKFYLS